MKVKLGSLATGIAVGGLSAAPIFVVSLLLMPALFAPGPLSERIVFLAVPLTLSIFPGCLIGIAVNGVSSGFMAFLGCHLPLARSRIMWTLAGSAVGLLLITLTEAIDEWAVALLIASTASVWLTRHWVEWES